MSSQKDFPYAFKTKLILPDKNLFIYLKDGFKEQEGKTKRQIFHPPYIPSGCSSCTGLSGKQHPEILSGFPMWVAAVSSTTFPVAFAGSQSRSRAVRLKSVLQ